MLSIRTYVGTAASLKENKASDIAKYNRKRWQRVSTALQLTVSVPGGSIVRKGGSKQEEDENNLGNPDISKYPNV